MRPQSSAARGHAALARCYSSAVMSAYLRPQYYCRQLAAFCSLIDTGSAAPLLKQTTECRCCKVTASHAVTFLTQVSLDRLAAPHVSIKGWATCKTFVLHTGSQLEGKFRYRVIRPC